MDTKSVVPYLLESAAKVVVEMSARDEQLIIEIWMRIYRLENRVLKSIFRPVPGKDRDFALVNLQVRLP